MTAACVSVRRRLLPAVVAWPGLQASFVLNLFFTISFTIEITIKAISQNFFWGPGAFLKGKPGLRRGHGVPWYGMHQASSMKCVDAC